MRKLILILTLMLIILLTAAVFDGTQRVQAAQVSTPAITSYSTPTTTVDRAALSQRLVRVPVNWRVATRPLTANLAFDQLFIDGSVVNVEVPRLLPWYASSGTTLLAPILPPGDVGQIVLRVRLYNVLNQQSYDERLLILNIDDTGTPGSDAGSVPHITSFVSTASTVAHSQIVNQAATLPVQWNVRNRPVTSNLVFEQIIGPETIINIEAPRATPWVASSGSGVLIPQLPASGDTINLRLRLVDLFTGRVYDQQFASVTISEPATATPPPPTPSPVIRSFTTSTPSVRAADLQQRSARVNVNWRVDNRPANSNLQFNQELPNGSLVNVELPRTTPIIPNSGSGTLAPIWPGGNATAITLHVRIIDMTSGYEHTRQRISIPIISEPQPPRIASFSTGVANVSAVALQNRTAQIPVTWSVVNRPTNSNLVFEQRLPNGTLVNVELPRPNPIVPSSGSGTVSPVWPGQNQSAIVLVLRLIDLSNGATYTSAEFSLPITSGPGPVEYGAVCFQSPYYASVGLSAGSTGQVIRGSTSGGLQVRNTPQGNFINTLPVGEPFDVLEGPACWRYGTVTPAGEYDHRLWRVRGRNSGIQGWVDEYARVGRDTIYYVEPRATGGYQTGQVCFQPPYAPQRNISTGIRARVVNGDTSNGLRVRNLPNGDFVETLPIGTEFMILEGPACWQIQTIAPADQYDFRVWRIRTIQHNLEAWVEEYGRVNAGSPFAYIEPVSAPPTQPPPGPPVINSFTADPTSVPRGGTVTLSWNVSNASTVDVRVTALGQVYSNQPLVGTLNYTLAPNLSDQINFVLSAGDASGQQVVSKNVTVTIACPISDTYEGCPLSQNSISAAYQTFERGLMLWRGDTRKIYVLYNSGGYEVYDDTWTPDQPADTGETPPPGLILPARGFGKVWANNPGVRSGLGWANGQEASYTARIEVYNLPTYSGAIYINTPDGRVLILENGWRVR